MKSMFVLNEIFQQFLGVVKAFDKRVVDVISKHHDFLFIRSDRRDFVLELGEEVLG